jgi:hypothetical protein
MLYNSNILNEFYIELFSTDFKDYDSVLQNAKTDYLFDAADFDDWFDYLINVFVEVTDLDVTAEEVTAEAAEHPDFISDLEKEYKTLREICYLEDDDF